MVEQFPPVPDLERCLQRLLAQVPAGRVTTCGDLAEALGNRIAARWVGHFALHHRHCGDCPCHRILRVGGALGGYVAGPIAAKTRRLAEEGVTLGDGEVDLDRFRFHGFVGQRPLEKLRKVQEAIQRKIILRPRRRMPKFVGGVDVAYPNGHEGVAAYALIETATCNLIWSTTVRRPVAFPYISTYLSFREIPILLMLLDKVRSAGRMAEVLLVDGSGILHHRHAGIASHLGVVASLPTVGVTKKLLCGKVDIKDMRPLDSRPIIYDAEKRGLVQFAGTARRVLRTNWTCPLFSDHLIGVALRPTAGSLRPIFVSPGHRVDVDFCERLVRGLLTGQRLPEPIYWADRLSREEAREAARETPAAR
jgi:deoxyribonuclease V